jgi:hypothetical protein
MRALLLWAADRRRMRRIRCSAGTTITYTATSRSSASTMRAPVLSAARRAVPGLPLPVSNSPGGTDASSIGNSGITGPPSVGSTVVLGAVVVVTPSGATSLSWSSLVPVYPAFGAPRLGVGSNSTQPMPARYTSGQAWA